MNFDYLVFVESVLLAGIFGTTAMLFYRMMRIYLMDRNAAALLRESKEIESLSNKRERAIRLVEWKRKRDASMMKADAYSRKISEAN